MITFSAAMTRHPREQKLCEPHGVCPTYQRVLFRTLKPYVPEARGLFRPPPCPIRTSIAPKFESGRSSRL